MTRTQDLEQARNSCSRQLTVKTSSSKKRKISARQQATKDEPSTYSSSSPDTPIPSFEHEPDLCFSFSASSDIVSPAASVYCRANSLPPASSLPPRLQTSTSSLSYAEYASSTASSPSAAYADLTISSDRGTNTPAPDPGSGSAVPNLYPIGRATSPFPKTTHHRALMGGSAEFPERSSSPLKRRASSMDPDPVNQDASEDVDMITAPPSEALRLSTSERPNGTPADSPASGAVGEPEADAADEATPPAGATSSTIPDTTSGHQPPPSLEAHLKTIRTLIQEQNAGSLTQGQRCYLVSRSWFAKVLDESSSKHTAEDLSTVPPVDNSDIILEVIPDPCANDVADPVNQNFVRLKHGYDTEQFEPIPPEAWSLLMQWPGLKDGQLPIIREAQTTNDDGTNIMWEWHPPVFPIYRLWSATSEMPVEASLKASNPPPPRLVRSRSTIFQEFLKQAKGVASIDLAQRVRAWNVPQPVANVDAVGASVPTPPASEDGRGEPPASSQAWRHLLLDVDSFNASPLARELVNFGDLTRQDTPSTKTLSSLGLGQDQAIVLDVHEGGHNWTSTPVPFQTRTSLPTRNNSTSLTVQNRNSRSGRTSPVSHGLQTRGRSLKSDKIPGCVGLANLGNSCYMNAALQCVRSVEELTKYFLSGEWEKELNKENLLAHNGDVAAAYAQLLKDIYRDPSPSSISPRQFKNTIGRYSAGFSGYGQQDSQEFLGFLLDGLQEDLSRIKKKPYIEKPDSTDEMVNDPDAIRQMAEKVWDITKKRDDSVIADLFTGLYKSTLVCPECQKVSITFDPFNNLTLPLPVENKWSHTIKFFPLNDRPVDIRVELDKHGSIKSLKEFVSARTGVPVERLFGAEEWKGKFYKHYSDLACASEEISANDNAWIFEIEAKPTNYGTKPHRQQKLGLPVRSMVDEGEHSVSASWDDEQAARLLVPVFHRRPSKKATPFQSSRWTSACLPHFIVVTPDEARSEDAIRRKILEKVATFTKKNITSSVEDTDASDSTDLELIGVGSSDAGSSNEGRIIAQSVKGEDDIVDVQMKDFGVKGSTPSKPAVKHIFCRKRPAWVDPMAFLQPELQNLFDLSYYSESGAWLPTGMNGVSDDKDYPRISLRAPPASPSSEDQLDNATNGTASNEDTSSDEAPRQSLEQTSTRMNDESDDEGVSPVVKAVPPRLKQGGRNKHKGKHGYGQKQQKTYKSHKGNKKRMRPRHHKERSLNLEHEDIFSTNEAGPDGGPLIRLREALVVDWSGRAYDELFVDSRSPSRHNSLATNSLATWDECELLPDPDLDKAQAARTRRRKNGITLEACLDEFEREEILSEQDMWYCPRCKEHRRASKKFDLWKTPDILIIHLKRFSSSGFRRDKLEVLVDFPLENLDITSRVLQREAGKQEVYDLIGVDNHWGGLGGGHYTAHAKNFLDGKWYTCNDSIVNEASTDRIVDSAAYLLFYRRRSEIPLGGPRFRQILEKFVDQESSDDELPGSGEGERLGECFSRIGSSSASLEAKALRQQGKINGNNDWDVGEVGPVHNMLPNLSQGVYRSIEEDEGVDLTQDTARSTGFQPLTGNNSWNFDSLGGESLRYEHDSPLDSGAATDEAQHDSSGDEQVMGPHNMDVEFEPDLEQDFPGMAHYELPSQPDADPPSYSEPPPPDCRGEVTRDDMNHIWDQKQVHKVPPEGEIETRSEAAAEIHLDDSDKLDDKLDDNLKLG
ncbi:UCH-domain-containing protein [Durotheca rogersii]|uniref:UCH-domain-containing protein n=1 Tax=Durotheca rogersii TaxID=419775 RepID=UPI0022206D47|nr:UCH-domain-containing protein [Durotheca rogersii]KAI5859320.1 UCH-domain-containing protein [Durotheca rogersii]